MKKYRLTDNCSELRKYIKNQRAIAHYIILVTQLCKKIYLFYLFLYIPLALVLSLLYFYL